MKKGYQYAVVFLFFLFLSACGTTALKKMKIEHGKGNYTVVVETQIKCNESDKTCNQLHLIKGDACYRLGKQSKEPVVNFDCAIKHLGKGIELTKHWIVGDLDLKKDQTYENLNESIRERQDLSKGDEAKKFTRQLMKASEQFMKASPGNLAAIYFNSSAKFTDLRFAIITKSEDPSVCKAVNSILSHLKAVKAKAENSKYAPQYSRLTLDISGIKPSLANCQ